MKLLFVCTGNAARSVIAATMARAVLDSAVQVKSAGTLSIEGRPMSQRTRTALDAFGLSDRDHLSHQLDETDLGWADLVVVFEPSHLLFIRKNHAHAASKTVTLRRLVALLGAMPQTLSVEEVMEAAELANIDPDPADETIDPAGGDQEAFDDAAREIGELIEVLAGAFDGRARSRSDTTGPEA